MTFPELCERSENRETIMPNTLATTNTLKKTPSSDSIITAASAAAAGHDNGATIAASAKAMVKMMTTTTMMGEEEEEDDNHNPNPHQVNVGEALKAVLQQAASQGRITCSLGASVDLLSSHPDDVMLCVMPLLPPHTDAAATIQSTLIRAVCLEHNIRVLTVDCDVKLAKTVVVAAPCASDEEEEEERAAVARRISLMIMEDEDEDEDCDDEEEEEWDDNCNRVLKTPSTCSEDVGASSSSSSPSSSSAFFSTCDNLVPVMGFPCVLVRYPTDGTSKEDELVAEFCKEQLFGYAHQDPYVELPD